LPGGSCGRRDDAGIDVVKNSDQLRDRPVGFFADFAKRVGRRPATRESGSPSAAVRAAIACLSVLRDSPSDSAAARRTCQSRSPSATIDCGTPAGASGVISKAIIAKLQFLLAAFMAAPSFMILTQDFPPQAR
jgi:hypothetical protein